MGLYDRMSYVGNHSCYEFESATHDAQKIESPSLPHLPLAPPFFPLPLLRRSLSLGEEGIAIPFIIEQSTFIFITLPRYGALLFPLPTLYKLSSQAKAESSALLYT